MTRDLLNSKIMCKVANQAMSDHYMIASVQVDINLRPMSTVITSELDSSEIKSGDNVHLLCKADGARPAATLRFFLKIY